MLNETRQAKINVINISARTSQSVIKPKDRKISRGKKSLDSVCCINKSEKDRVPEKYFMKNSETNHWSVQGTFTQYFVINRNNNKGGKIQATDKITISVLP
ncbi:MAG: hypothetical protein GY749_41450 [Desulfobacteraceae bacterium]|nr:hypothetical protein [Desulfobacteraceae bacterium]